MIKGKFLVENETIKPVDGFNPEILQDTPAIYEVIRLINGIPLFVEDHLARLQASSKLVFGKDLIDQAGLMRIILQLSKKNQITEGNVKIFVRPNSHAPGNLSAKSYVFFISHHYPTPEAYLRGYCMKSLQLERPNPNAKVVNKNLTERVSILKARDTSIDEILLVRHDGIITEGSKSNVFFIKGKQVITSHKTLVLAGITRDKIMEICTKNQIDCLESSSLKTSDLTLMEGAFITGTSPKVMPVSKIDNIQFDAGNSLIKSISKLYDAMIVRYLKSFRPF